MMTKRKPKPPVSPKPVRAEPRKSEIPDKILRDFLEEKINLSSLENISMYRAGFLWEVRGVERYRVNVWSKTYEDGQFCPNTKIAYSFFILYYPEDCSIVDKTTE
jgi:hypothetical protein